MATQELKLPLESIVVDALTVPGGLSNSKSQIDLYIPDIRGKISGRRLSTPVTPGIKSTSLPNHQRRRLSANVPQGGAIFLNNRRKQKSLDMSLLSDSNDGTNSPMRMQSPSHIPDQSGGANSKNYYCDYVVEEILVTERQYVQDLEDIVLMVCPAAVSHLKCHLVSPDTRLSISCYFNKEVYLECSRKILNLPEDDEKDIFGNIEDIYEFHSSFLYDLETCGEKPITIARCFVGRSKEFEIYATYVTNYPKAFTSLTKLLRNPDIAEAFRQQQVRLGHGLPIGSYLHKPVQRILKYHLLMQSLLKHFPEDLEGREVILAASHCMTDCAKHINEMKRSHEHAMKIQEIQSTLYDFDGHNLFEFGKLVLEGDLKSYGTRTLRPVHVYLFEKAVIICKKREDGAFSCKTTIMCRNLMLIESVPREPLSFHFVPYDNPRTQYTLQAKTLEHKREWCSLVKKYILESYNVPIPDKAKELILQLTGKSESEEKIAKYFKSFTFRPHQPKTPDYIERKRRKSQPILSSRSCDGLSLPKARVCGNSNRSMGSLAADTSYGSESMPIPAVSNQKPSAPTLTTDSLNPSTKNPSLTAQHVMLGKSFNLGSSSLTAADLHAEDGFCGSQECPSPSSGHSNHRDSLEVLHSPPYHSSPLPAGQPFSEVLANIFPPSPNPSPTLHRRHSLPQLCSQSDEYSQYLATFTYGRCHEEGSLRARQLERLLDDRSGLDDPTWSPEVISIVKRYRPPNVKRADSYAQAQQSSLTLPRPSKPSFHSRYKSASEEMFTEAIPSSDVHVEPPVVKSKTETSVLLNKLSQLKEKTSHRLTDLLKKSPVRIFKDPINSSSECDSHDTLHMQSVVGRRLSSIDLVSHVSEPTVFTQDGSKSCSLPRTAYRRQSGTTLEETNKLDENFMDYKTSSETLLTIAIPNSTVNINGDFEQNVIEPKDTSKKCSSSQSLEKGSIVDDGISEIHFASLKVDVTNQDVTSPASVSPHECDKSTVTKSCDDVTRMNRELSTTETNEGVSPDCGSKVPGDFWEALEKYIETGRFTKAAKINHRPLSICECDVNDNLELSTLPIENSDELLTTPYKNPLSNRLKSTSETRPGKVYKLARKYSTRIRSTAEDVDDKPSSPVMHKIKKQPSDDRVTTSPKTPLPRRIESVKLRRTNSSKIKKFTVMLDSDDEGKADSGIQQCDFDSGSDCNDIYELQSMAALESFVADDYEKRDSAIYSDSEENSMVSPVVSESSNAFSADFGFAHGSKEMYRNSKHCSMPPLTRCKSLPHCSSLICNPADEDFSTRSIDGVVTAPVSNSILERVESLQKNSVYKKDNAANPCQTIRNRLYTPFTHLSSQPQSPRNSTSSIVKCDVRLRLWSSGAKYGKKYKIPPLSEEMAIDVGADLLGEAFIFFVAAGALGLEYYRQSVNAARKDEQQDLSLTKLEKDIRSLNRKIEAVDDDINELVRLTEVLKDFSIDRKLQ